MQFGDVFNPHAPASERDVLPGVVGGFRLRQRGYVGARERHAAVRLENELAAAVRERAQLAHPARPPQLREQVY